MKYLIIIVIVLIGYVVYSHKDKEIPIDDEEIKDTLRRDIINLEISIVNFSNGRFLMEKKIKEKEEQLKKLVKKYEDEQAKI